jgi:SAM-dependent methyltransferase
MVGNYIRQTAEAYELLASETEERASDKMPFVRELAAGFSSQVTTGRVLYDLGCGVGLATRAFVDLGFDVTGIDVSARTLAFAKQRNPDAVFIQRDFLDFTSSQQVDGIFANAFIHLFTEIDAKVVLNKMHDLLKKGGAAFVSTDLCGESKEGVFEKPYYRKKVRRLKRFWARQELEDAVAGSGFRLERSFVVPDYYRDFKWLILYASKA